MEQEYPDHIYDPNRIQLAVSYIQHELHKMLRSLPQAALQILDQDVAGWFAGGKYELAGAHDFWNGFEGFSRGYKLKGLITLITAENISWSLQELPVDQLQIGVELEMMNMIGELPHTYAQVQTAIQNPQVKAKLENLAQKYLGGVNKDSEPIIIMKRQDKFQTLDGNARIARALIYGRETISAWVGEFTADNKPLNYWVSTGTLMDFVRLAKQNETNEQVLAATRLLIRHLVSTLPIARINYQKRVLRTNDLSSELVAGIISPQS